MTLRQRNDEKGARDGGGAPSARSIPVDWEALARTHAHPLRVSILEILGIDGGRVMSPTELCFELQLYLSKVDYHVDRLHDAGLIIMVRKRPVRGATEHFYRLAPRCT